MAGRGFTLDAASQPRDRRPALPRTTSATRPITASPRALQLALWATPGAERLREHPAVRRPRRLVALATFVRQADRDPRRSSGHIARLTSPSFSSRPTVRDSALWLRCTQRPAPASSAARRIRTRGARAPRTRSSRARARRAPRPARRPCAHAVPAARAIRCEVCRHTSIVPRAYIANALDAHACMLGAMTSSPPPPSVGRPPLGRAVPAVRDRLPRRARRLDGRRRTPVDPGRPRPHHLPAAVGRLGLRARPRRPAAARRPRRRSARPAARADRRARRLHGRLARRRARRRRRPADRRALPQGRAAAFTVPAALSLITTTFTEGPGRNKAIAIFNAFGASGFSFGLSSAGC